MSAKRFFIFALLILPLSACFLMPPNEAAMSAAINIHVIKAEDYPREFVVSENFRFQNLQKIPDSQPSKYQVEAEFDITYTEDGETIVAGLDKKNQQQREKEKRRTNSPFEEIKGAITGAVDNFRYENRFKNVRKGDQDHYQGEFILVQNADHSWRVDSASYE
jgi:hypothetical protein